MPIAPARTKTLLLSLLAAGALTAAALLLLSGASDNVDAVTTGSVDAGAITPIPISTVPVTVARVDEGVVAPEPDTTAVPVAEDVPVAEVTRGSAEFREALQLIADDKHVEAFARASGLGDDAERRTIQWAAIYNGGGAIDYASVIRFTADAPDFADSSVLKTRLEQALTRANAAGPEVIRVLGGAMPNTVDAQVALALAYVEDGQHERAAGIARSIWTTRFLTRSDEDKVRARLGGLLTPDDHWDRAVHLMMNDRATGVERIMSFLTPAQKSLATARNAVSRNAANAKRLLDNTDPSMQEHPVFLFSRGQRARQFELWEDAVTWLDKAEAEVPNAAQWWQERRLLARQLIVRRDFERAYRAAAGLRSGPAGPMVEASFHAGWIAFSFLNDAETALGHFETMLEHATLPDSITQALYWTGRAKTALGDEAGAAEAYAAATHHGTAFYGLLARAELGMAGADLRDMPEWQQVEETFESADVVKAVRLLAANDHEALAVPLLRDYATGLQDAGELMLAARLAQSLDAHHLAIQIADIAERRGMPLDVFSFPKEGLPDLQVAEVDLAAVYAVTKQESHFRVDAVSSAGARGLMQLMPGTAKETAEKVGVEYSPSRLTSDAAYNTLLGSTYLAAQLARFDGSLVLAAAAYNAGAGNALRWIDAYGDPRADNVDPVVWMELIPFHETRNYVKRVLGNYLVYRARLGESAVSMRDALRAIY